MINEIICGDCLEVMDGIPTGSVDMVLCDLPYGMTGCNWDNPLPLAELWRHYLRVAKHNAAFVFTGKGLFSVDLINSQRRLYRYSLVWEKTCPMGFINAKRMPLSYHEDILVFYQKQPTYNPQMEKGEPYLKKRDGVCAVYGQIERRDSLNTGYRYPKSIIKVSNHNYGSKHPTQKPVALFEWLIKTYSNEGDLILDNCIGSGTTAIAALNTGRRFIGIELDPKYCEIARARVAEANGGAV